MNKFRVVLTDHAVNDLKDIPKQARTQIHEDLTALEAKPFPSGTHIKRLRGFRPPVYRLRSGNFRVLYRIQGDTVAILRVIDRKLLERIIKRLKI
ncbi:MAG: type II toxin-antitoxin system RelE/ParE family toxin [candidate division Zixibacteria bacterium]|nr:type II toxin-antitoxin system RelE/ParE family toxin [candidate division Zixibacteria bacterium]